MATYTTFTRLTQPDPDALLTALRAIELTAGFAPIYEGTTLVVKTTGPLAPAQIAAMQTAITTAAIRSPESAAQTLIDRMPIETKALLLTLLDQLNLVRSKLVPPLGAITPATAIQAVRDKAATL